MAGSLIKIDEEIVTSAVASVTLTGIDSTYDVYQVVINNCEIDTATASHILCRVTVSGTPDTTANYDRARKVFRTDTTFTNDGASNQTFTYIGAQINTTTNYQHNSIMYLFNFNNASEYSSATLESATTMVSGYLFGNQGGWVHTVAQSCDGVQIYSENGNIDNGTFTLYGLKK